MSEEIKNIMNNIENKWKDYYVQDIITNDELKSLHDFAKQLLEFNHTLNNFITNKIEKDKFVVLKNAVININDIVSLEYIKYNRILYITLRNIEIPIKINEFYNMDYEILLAVLRGK